MVPSTVLRFSRVNNRTPNWIGARGKKSATPLPYDCMPHKKKKQKHLPNFLKTFFERTLLNNNSDLKCEKDSRCVIVAKPKSHELNVFCPLSKHIGMNNVFVRCHRKMLTFLLAENDPQHNEKKSNRVLIIPDQLMQK